MTLSFVSISRLTLSGSCRSSEPAITHLPSFRFELGETLGKSVLFGEFEKCRRIREPSAGAFAVRSPSRFLSVDAAPLTLVTPWSSLVSQASSANQ